MVTGRRGGAPYTPPLPHTHIYIRFPQFITCRLLYDDDGVHTHTYKRTAVERIAYNVLHETVVAIGFADETEYGHKNGSDVAAWLPCTIRRGHVERRQTNAPSRVDVWMVNWRFEYHIWRLEWIAFWNGHIHVEDTTFPRCSRRCRYLCFDLIDILDNVLV